MEAAHRSSYRKGPGNRYAVPEPRHRPSIAQHHLQTPGSWTLSRVLRSKRQPKEAKCEKNAISLHIICETVQEETVPRGPNVRKKMNDSLTLEIGWNFVLSIPLIINSTYDVTGGENGRRRRKSENVGILLRWIS